MKPLYFLLLCNCFFGIANAQLNTPYTLTNTMQARNAVDADLNGDGLHDIISQCDDRIGWAENLGGGQFAKMQRLQLPGLDFFLRFAVIDLDNDGDNDIIGAHFNNYPEYSLSLWRNQGFMLFDEEETLHTSDESTGAPLVFDFDNDGWDDIVFCTDGKLKTFKNNNGVLEEFAFQTITSTTLSEMQLVDLNEDGVQDLVAVDNSGQTLRRFLGGTPGHFQSGVTMANGTYIHDVHVQDMNNDGNLDVIYNNGNDTNEFKIGLNSGSEFFTQVNDFSPLSSNYLSTLNYSDWNNDGFEDVIAFYDYPQELMFYTWNGMELELQFTWPTVGEFMHVTEVETQDGDADPQFTISGSPIANRVALFEVYPNLELNFQELDESISSWADIRVADLDGDGYTEVITGGSRNRRLAYYHNQQASFSALQTIDFIPGASDNFNIEVQDADADGDMDIAAFNYEGSWLMLYMNDGNAQFTLEYVNVPYEVTSWFAADVDADQRMDYFFHGNGSLNMKMLWGSDLDNTQFQNLDFGSNDFWGIKAMDYDHDNDLDFVLNGIDTDGNGLLQLRVNDGSADPQTWAYFDIELPEATLSISNVFSSLDYNGDGYEDLIFDDGTTGNTYFIPLTSAGFGAITPFPYTDFMGVDKTHDVDGDGDKEFIARYNNLYHVFNETAPGVWESTGIYSINFSGLWLYGFQNFDMSGTPEVLTVDQENIYIDRLVLYPFGWSFTSAIFLDENANGLMDGNETIMNNAYVELDGMYNAVYQGTGTYWLPAQSGAYTVSPLYDNEVWQLTTDSASYLLDVNTEEDIPNYTLLFGLTPLGTVMSGEISTTAFGWSCILDSFTSSTVVHNTGNSYMSGVVQLEFDSSLVSVINTEPMADSIVGNTIYWSVDSLLPLSTFQYGAVFTHPGVENIGELAEFHSSLFITDALLFVDDYADANFVECAYDPNDKQVTPQGFSPNGYVLADTAMEYTIRFQNTGNAPAQDVIIADQLSTHLDASSLHVLGASHPMVLQVADDGLVHFHFQNIMLPDSTADYMGSMGYVKYAIEMMPSLEPGTTLQNTAHIFFDTNPPIVTNTTLNTIYTCEWLHTPVLVHYDDSLLWAPVGGIDYTWYRYGSEITIADGNTFNPLLPGEYTVLVQFEDDCEVLSEIFYYLVDEVDEITASARVHLYPNPAGEQFLVVSDQLINDITLFDAMGRAVCQRNVFAYNYSFNDLPLSPGLYLVQVSMGDYRETLRLVKK